jgi:hypothetical protein
VAAIHQLGARVVRTAGTYDDSVRIAAQAAADKGWLLVSDTSDDPRAETSGAFPSFTGHRLWNGVGAGREWASGRSHGPKMRFKDSTLFS